VSDHPESVPEWGDDPLLEEIFSQLRRLDPPLETRVANHMAIAAELSRLLDAKRSQQLPWWRRSISIPVPLAASLLVLTALVLSASYRGWQERLTSHVAAPDRSAESDATADGEKAVFAMHKPNAHEVSKHYETETYLCGFGRVNSESYYFIKEQTP
jgi:hypothetical protein